jgi:sigma-B regulation protein RsbU (phosphoserine phosphatase)
MSPDKLVQNQGDRLALLYHLSQLFNSTLDLDEVLNHVIDEVLTAVRGERGFVMLREADGPLTFRVARGMDRETIDSPQFQVSRGVVERVADDGQPVLTSDARTDDRFSMRRSVVDLGLRSILCVPLSAKGRVLGVVYVDNRLQAGLFGQSDLELLTSIASSAAIAIENARLYQVAIEKGRMERELQMAYELQAGLLPGQPPPLAGWEFAACWLPARQVAGDYYDLFLLADGSLALVIADVCDKGMPAALFMALSRSIVRASLDGAPSPAEGLARANRLIHADAANGMFVTLFCARFEPDVGQINYANAGHDAPLLSRGSGDGSPFTPLLPTGPALGLFPDATFEQGTVHLDPGDLILFYTDGVTDATNAQAEHFGKQRLERLLRENQQRGAPQLIAALESAVQAFAGGEAPFDDVTIMAARRARPGQEG